MANVYREKALREEYVKLRNENIAKGLHKTLADGKTIYTDDELWALRQMARENVYPNGEFSDNECVVWGWFR